MLLSCIMVTANRPRFVPVAIDCFARQTFPIQEMELVIVDDGDISVRDLARTGVTNVRYFARKKSGKDASIGRLRNLAVDLARGDFIAHWDDDDISLPGRLFKQMGWCDLSDPYFLSGFNRMPFFDERDRRVWSFDYRQTGCGVFGTSLIYRREVWRQLPFNEDKLFGEDVDFVNRWRERWSRGRPPAVSAGDDHTPLQMVARVHGASTSPHFFTGEDWNVVPPESELGRAVLGQIDYSRTREGVR